MCKRLCLHLVHHVPFRNSRISTKAPSDTSGESARITTMMISSLRVCSGSLANMFRQPQQHCWVR